MNYFFDEPTTLHSSDNFNSNDGQQKKITDQKTSDVYGIMVMNQSAINDIYKNSGPLAVHEEFQMHYTALTTRISIDNQLLFINIPLVFYNYEQYVSSGSVSFNCGTVQEVSDAVEPLAQTQAKLLLSQPSTAKLNEVIQKIFNVAPEWELTTMHTMHRHPGQMNHFSGIDYQKNFNQPGIVYPIMDCEPNTPSFSSIICDYKDTMKLVHTECRTVTTTDNEIGYKQGRCTSLVAGHKYKASLLDQVFGCTKEDIEPYALLSDNMKLPVDLYTALFLAVENLEISTDFIEPENVHSFRDKPKENKTESYEATYKYQPNNNDLGEGTINKANLLLKNSSHIYKTDEYSGLTLFNESHVSFSISDLRTILEAEVVQYGYTIKEIQEVSNLNFFEECETLGIIDRIPKLVKDYK